MTASSITQIKTLKFILFSLYYYNLFNTLFSVLIGVNLSSAYNYKGITGSIFKENNNKGFTTGNLIVVSILAITIKIIIIREEFTIFEFKNNYFKSFYIIFVDRGYLYGNYLII